MKFKLHQRVNVIVSGKLILLNLEIVGINKRYKLYMLDYSPDEKTRGICNSTNTAGYLINNIVSDPRRNDECYSEKINSMKSNKIMVWLYGDNLRLSDEGVKCRKYTTENL